MIRSMTGFASGQGQHQSYSWSWDLRGVNGRGLDLRLRLPDWIGGLEQGLRAELGKALARGNVTVSLRLSRDAGQSAPQIDRAALRGLLSELAEIDAEAAMRGLSLAAPSALDLLNHRALSNVQERDNGGEGELAARLLADFGPVLRGFVAMRETEGAVLAQVIGDQIDRIEALVKEAAETAGRRAEATRAALRRNLRKILDAAEEPDETRLAQELALLAVKSDITEETDRLNAHVAAGRKLLSQGGVIGRKLDFLTQEFNREANTLCSKSGDQELTRIGLDLKAVIDQMREQIQNVE